MLHGDRCFNIDLSCSPAPPPSGSADICLFSLGYFNMASTWDILIIALIIQYCITLNNCSVVERFSRFVDNVTRTSRGEDMTVLCVQMCALWSVLLPHGDHLMPVNPAVSSSFSLSLFLCGACRSQSIVNWSLPDSFCALLSGVLSIETDSPGQGMALLRNVRVFAEGAALLANGGSRDIDPPAFSSLAPGRWHRNCSTSKEPCEIKRSSVLSRLLLI